MSTQLVMMKTLGTLTFCIAIGASNLHAQSISDLFSREGLSINAFHLNWFDGEYSTSFTFYRKEERCGREVLVYIENQRGYEEVFTVENDKLYRVHTNCALLLHYDFGMIPGEKVADGEYKGLTFLSKEKILLLNGDSVYAHTLEGHLGQKTVWIEGIGDVSTGIRINYDFEGYDQFVCAKFGDELLWEDMVEGIRCDQFSCARPFASAEGQQIGFDLTLENNSIFASDYLWDFGDGNTSTEAEPSHTYSTPGCYSVTLHVENQCGSWSNYHVGNYPVCIDDPWKKDYTIDTAFNLTISKYSEELEFIYSGLIVYRTTDQGAHWQQAEVPPAAPGVNRFITQLKMFDVHRGVMTFGHYNGMGNESDVAITRDGGLTWEEKAPGSYFLYRCAVSIDGKAWIPGGSLLRSDDYGETWEIIHYDSIRTYSIQHVDDVLVGTGYVGVQPNATFGIIHSYDEGDTWSWTPVSDTLFFLHFFNALDGYGVSAYRNLFRTSDGGKNWSHVPLPFALKEWTYHSIDTAWLLDSTNLVHYTVDGMNSFVRSNCGMDRIKDIQAESGTEAHVACLRLDNNPLTGQFKKTFRMAEQVDCSIDTDGDGHPDYADCDPNNISIHPYAEEIPNNGIDEDCDGEDEVLSVSDPLNNSIYLYPNPALQTVHIGNDFNVDFSIMLFDAHGKLMLSTDNASVLNVDSYPRGIYAALIVEHASQKRYAQRLVLWR